MSTYNPFNFNIGTSVNGQPNYDIGMTVDPGLLNAANQAYRGLGSPSWGGSSGGSSGGGWSWNQGPGGQSDAQTQQVQDDQLMSDQMASLLAADNPYMQRARREGEAIAGRRGLMNSSIMAGASMGAAIDRAAPIAQFDASRYGSVADQNMSAENQHRLQNAQLAAQMSAAGAGASAQRYSADRARQSALDQMFLGHQFGALDDYRRHALGMEQREDTQSFQGGQSDIDRFIQQQQFWDHQAPLAWQQQGHGQNMDWANYGLNQRSLDANIYQNQFNPFFGALSGIYSNPNLSAEQMNAAAGNMGQMFPNFAQAAWSSLPPGLFNQQAYGAAQNMPPMPPMNMRRGGG